MNSNTKIETTKNKTKNKLKQKQNKEKVNSKLKNENIKLNKTEIIHKNENPNIMCNIIKFYTTDKNCKNYDNYKEHIWDFSNQLNIEDFLKVCKYDFKYGGCIKAFNNEKKKEEYKTVGYKIDVINEFKNSKYILYLMTICLPCGEKIIKGGKVKGTLPSRTYSAGTEYNWTMKGSPSPTNYIYSQIFRQCIKDNIKINFYIHKTPVTEIKYYTARGKEVINTISPYEEMEKSLQQLLKKELGRNIIGEGDLHINTFKK